MKHYSGEAHGGVVREAQVDRAVGAAKYTVDRARAAADLPVPMLQRRKAQEVVRPRLRGGEKKRLIHT